MGKLTEFADKLEQLDFNEEFDNVIESLESVITQLNKDQLEIGTDANNQQLMAYESPEYAVWKVNFGGSIAPLGIPNLKLSGDFYNDFAIGITPESILISSRDWKTPLLKKKYGSDIFGLQQKKLSILANRYVKPQLSKKIKNKI